jgi:hypothetical protein
MKNAVRWLRISFWIGAIWDALEAVLMLFPDSFVSYIGFSLSANRSFAYGLAYGAPLMAGWTVLLIWADRKPLERKGVLLITVAPVVIGYAAIQVVGAITRAIPIERCVSTLAVIVLFACLLTFSYVNAAHKQRAAGRAG